MQYPQTRYEDSLLLGINDTDLSLQCSLVAPTRTQGILTLGRVQGNTEDIYYTNVAGTVVTISLRGLSQTALTPTQVIGNRKVHSASESIEITTHHLYDANKARKDENETIDGSWEFTGTETFADDKARSKTNAAPSDQKSFANKKYVDDQLAAIGDVKFKVSATDTTTNYGYDKVKEVGSINLNIKNPTGNEILEIGGLYATAAEDMSATDIASVNSSGQFEKTVIGNGWNTADALGPGAVSTNSSMAILSDTLVVFAYRLDGDNDLYVIAGTRATNNRITWGSPATFKASITATSVSVSKIDATRFLITGSDGANNGHYAVGSVSGNTITLGTVNTAGTHLYSKSCIIDTDKGLWLYSGGGVLNAQVMTISGTSITLETPVASAITPAAAMNSDLAKIDTNKAISLYNVNAAGISAVVITVSGTVPSFGSAVVVNAQPSSTDIKVKFLETNKIIASFYESGAQGYIIAASISGTVPTFGSRVSLSATTTLEHARVLPITATWGIAGLFDQTTSASETYYYTLSGTTITLVGRFNASHPTSILDTLCGAMDWATFSKTGDWVAVGKDTTNLYSQVYAGYNNTSTVLGSIAELVLASGTAKIKPRGLLGGFSSLTIGSKYYLQTDNTVSTTESPVYLGIAKSATEIWLDVKITPSYSYANTFTKDLTLVETVRYTHGAGVMPKKIEFFVPSNSPDTGDWGKGFWTLGGQQGFFVDSASPPTYVHGTDAAIFFGGTSTAYVKGVVSNVTETNFDITWTKVGAPSAGPFSFSYTILT